jgi:hypothetical protein
MDEIVFNADFTQLYRIKPWLLAYVGKAVKNAVNLTTLALRNHIIQDLFQSYTMIGPKNKGVLNSRSGELKKSVQSVPAEVDGDDIKGKVAIGTVYARTHFGPAGQTTHVTAINVKMLAIPLLGAMDSHGSARGNPRDAAIFGQTFISKSKAGNLIIFGKLNYVKGAKAGQAKGDILPLFLLKESVDVPVTVTTESLRAYAQPLMGKRLFDIKTGLESSTVTA